MWVYIRISTESNIPDFRSANGLWNEKLKINLTPEQLVSHTMFMRYPEEFFKFYKDKLIYSEAKPNAAYIALAKLEEMGKLKAVVTQNINGLHQAAGLIDYFKGKNLVLINKSSTSADNRADLVIHEAIGKVLGEVVKNL